MTEDDIKAGAQGMDEPQPLFSKLDWSSVMEHASSPEMTVSLCKVSKLLGRMTHQVAWVAQVIMVYVGLHFTASGLISWHVDNVQQPNLQGAWQILQWISSLIVNFDQYCKSMLVWQVKHLLYVSGDSMYSPPLLLSSVPKKKTKDPNNKEANETKDNTE